MTIYNESEMKYIIKTAFTMRACKLLIAFLLIALTPSFCAAQEVRLTKSDSLAIKGLPRNVKIQFARCLIDQDYLEVCKIDRNKYLSLYEESAISLKRANKRLLRQRRRNMAVLPIIFTGGLLVGFILK